MPSPVRVLLCDDSAVVRRLVRTAFARDARLEVVGEAADGRDGVDAFDRLRPDLVLMDVEMPRMDGVEAVAAIRQRSSTVPIVMFSTLTSGGSEAALDALAAGATDVALKPDAAADVADSLSSLADLLVACAAATRPQTQPTVRPACRVEAGAGQAAHVVAIAASTGGPEALKQILSRLPADFAAPILIVQHVPASFAGLIADRLNAVSPLRVSVAEDGEPLRAGQVLLAPGDRHLTVGRHRTEVVA
ncbi:MAG: chemotaxis protein CheB, partial [Planctomycetota bacterium]